jgi:L-asparaginase / beta-aspartyl-peptidase
MPVRAIGRRLTPGGALLLVLLCLLVVAGFAGLGLGGSAQRPDEARAAGADNVGNVVFAIHGGAGDITRESVPPELEQQYRAALRVALEAGYGVIQRGGEATDAVKAAIVTMEDSPLFNAGKGAVFTTDAKHELDASIMDGETLDTGAVTGVEHIKNPIELADTVRTASRHVFFAGQGAELFAIDRGFDLVTQDYFFTDRRWQGARRGEGRQVGVQFRPRHGRGGGPRPAARPGGGDLDGRPDEQARRQDRRLAGHWRRDLREQRYGRCLRHGHRGVLHPAGRRT